MPSPAAPDALTVTDGAVTVGFITERGAKIRFRRHRQADRRDKTRVEADPRDSELIKQASSILKRARCAP